LAILTKSIRKIFGKQDLPLRVFLAIAIISAGFLILPMWNYSMFYLAWSRIDYKVLDVTINPTQVNVTSSPLVKVTFLVTNPTGYSGLEVGYITCNLEYRGDTHTVPVIIAGRPTTGVRSTDLWDLRIGSDPQWYQVGPNANRTIVLEVRINPNSGDSYERQYALDFLVYVGDKPSSIRWFLDCDLSVNSFMGSLDAGEKYFEPQTPLS
jgi:hypothetical protein